jgi:hypothetical protein
VELGTYLASEALQLDPNDVGASSGPQAGAPVSNYKIVSNAAADKARTDELYAFRAAVAAAEPEPGQQAAKPAPRPLLRILTIGAIALAGIALLVLVFFAFPNIPTLGKQKPTALYIDLGNRRFDPAGLSGRLIVRWQDKAAYDFYLDPVDQQDAGDIQALAENPTHPLSVVIRLLDASGMVACEKEIDFPASAQPGSAPDPTQALVPKTTAAGDTIRDLEGSDGQVAEINSSGPLPCPLKAYQRIAAWDFATNFPTAADRENEARQETAKGLGTGSSRSRFGAGWRLSTIRFQHLPAPIEGDDVIVGDNPARGTIDTSSGREFLVGGGGARSSEWQIFPSAIHFRCEKTGVCTLARYSSHAILQARLVR